MNTGLALGLYVVGVLGACGAMFMAFTYLVFYLSPQDAPRQWVRHFVIVLILMIVALLFAYIGGVGNDWYRNAHGQA